jgi:hypothetical protein
MRKFFLFILLTLTISDSIIAQKSDSETNLEKKLNHFFETYSQQGTKMDKQPKMLSYKLNDDNRTLDIYADDYFGAQGFSNVVTEFIYKRIKKTIPQPYNSYKITIYANSTPIDELIPNRLLENPDQTRLWGDIEYKGLPWVFNVSKPYKIHNGLQDRHISLWASHGRYYNVMQKKWEWQRPLLFCTIEDLFTQTIVVPYLIPMLQNAGAIVFTPRERDWQKNEIIVDNDCDNSDKSYEESGKAEMWRSTNLKGFAYHSGPYIENENPFTEGTARMATAVSHKKGTSTISYCPNISKDGKYAVYVSYQTLANSVPDAHYTIWHKGEKTEFTVNQQMGGGTWVYVGTFDFDKGHNKFNRITVTNESNYRGVVTADAVRFGGGMGNISREGKISGLPRCLEGARYYAQWAGMDTTVYNSKKCTDDYGDDINTRPYMTNCLGGGSVYMPTINGDKVPFELSLAIHSDAGFATNDSDIIGSLSICTTDFNDGKLNAGISRMASHDFSDALLSGVMRDIKYKYGKWNRRELFDRNYSETRNPEVPSAILETMSHQNFLDMRYGQDPNFRFTLARSIYKTILRYISDQHGDNFIVTPLAPNQLYIDLLQKGVATLHWSPVIDPQEPTSTPTSYIVYTASGHGGFDNGIVVRSGTSFSQKLVPGVIYDFRVAAINKGGESFSSETLSTLYQPNSTKTIMIVNGFHRLSSPAIRNNDIEQGFDLDEDPGVSYGPTAGWCGRQKNFNRNEKGIGLGDCGEELSGLFIAGNDFNYPRTHGEAIKTVGRYSFVSCSSEAVEAMKVHLQNYAMIDLILGLEKNDGHSLNNYKSFTPILQNQISSLTHSGGALLVSGSYIGSDMTSNQEQTFLANILKYRLGGSEKSNINDSIYGMGTSMNIYRTINEDHYATTAPDILQPVKPAYSTLQYSDGQSAGVAFCGKDFRCISIGFPFECIKSERTRATIMKGILNFLDKVKP